MSTLTFTQDKTPLKFLPSLLVGVFILNQVMIGLVARDLGVHSGMPNMVHLLSIKGANAMEIMMPIPNEDGMTTHLRMMPTITEVSAEPNSGDSIQDAMAVMIATGTPFYAPEGIHFDDPVGALNLWAGYENSITLTPELEARYKRLIGVFPCNFCCGSPTAVTMNGRCGCAHARAGRGFFKHMLSQYGDTYTDDQLVGEGYRWQAIWYPAGVVEDYLLATGRGDMLGHKTHGGAGSDGMHGLAE